MIDYSALPCREIEKLAQSLQPGEWAVGCERPIATLLGSCVAVCLIDRGLNLAGMNHFMLPQMSRKTHAADDIQLAGDACMAALLNSMLANGAARHRIRAKAFGGGAIIEANQSGSHSIGKSNAEFAREWLNRENIPIIASDFLGPWSRKVLLVLCNGDAYCKRVTSKLIGMEALAREEKAYVESLSQAPRVDERKKIEVFG